MTLAAAALARRLLSPTSMRRIEARFHPHMYDGNGYVVVGYVVSDDSGSNSRAWVEAVPVVEGGPAAHPMLLTLRHLVRLAGSQTIERLACLTSARWSFVDVTSPDASQRAT
jgi:hypothetical protein